MFRFEHPYYLYALALVPLLALVFLLYSRWRKRALSRLGDTSLVKSLMPEAGKYKPTIKFFLLLLGLSLLIIGWANPQWGSKREKVTTKSIDVVIALDISTSMYAEDIPPSRLDRAKRFAEDLVDKLKGDRVGLILFAGSAYLQMPVTNDYAAAKLFIRSADPDLAGTQGTVIGEAINVARKSFTEENKSHKALVIITDGEDHESEALEQATMAKEENIFLFTVGVGTSAGSFIPIMIGNRADYKRDLSGQPIRSRLNEEVMVEIAQTGGGNYYHISDGNAIFDALQSRIDQLEKQEMEVRSFTDYNSYFQYFLGAGLLFIILEFLISYRKENFMKGKDLFG